MIYYYVLPEPDAGEHIVPVHPYMPWAGAVSAIGVLVCSAVFIAITPRGEALGYISEGIEGHCGWSGVVLGTAGTVIGFCELLAALHVWRVDLVVAVALQLVSWNLILGVSDTGWALHYVALGIFMCASLWYHLVLSRSAIYGHTFYVCAHAVTVLVAVCFAVSFGVTAAQPPDSHAWSIARDVAVALEFTLTCGLTLNTLCLTWVLNSYSSIHLVFRKTPEV